MNIKNLLLVALLCACFHAEAMETSRENKRAITLKIRLFAAFNELCARARKEACTYSQKALGTKEDYKEEPGDKKRGKELSESSH